MNQAEIAKIALKLRFNAKPYKIKNVQGYRGGLDLLRKNVTALFLHERIETTEVRANATRNYAEKLISDAVLYGENHKPTMEMATWWLDSDKSAVHKLFKVLVPRYQDFSTCYTRIFFSPHRIRTLEEFEMPTAMQPRYKLAVLELKGHPFPKFEYSNTRPNKNHIHNVLLAEAKRDIDRLKVD